MKLFLSIIILCTKTIQLRYIALIFFPSLCIHTPSHKQNIICHQQPRRPQFRMMTKPQFYMILKLWTFLLLLFVSECWLLEPLLFPLEAEIKIANLSDIYQKTQSSVQSRQIKWNFPMGLSIHLKWSEVKFAQSCPTLCDPMDYTVHGILQAKILGWVAYPFSRGSSWPRNRTRVSCIAGRFFREKQKHPALLTLFLNQHCRKPRP